LVGTLRCGVPGGKAAGIAPAWGADGAARRPYHRRVRDAFFWVGTPRCDDPGGKAAGIAPAWGADGAARRPYHRRVRDTFFWVGTLRCGVPGGKAAGIAPVWGAGRRSAPSLPWESYRRRLDCLPRHLAFYNSKI